MLLYTSRLLALVTVVLICWGAIRLNAIVETMRPVPPPEMVKIPAGAYPSGPDRVPRNLPEFHIDRREVTNGDFAAFLKATGYRPQGNWQVYAGPGRENHPVVGVTWKDATCFAWHHDKRLPTAWEWEKACRGPEGRIYPWGNEWKDGLACVNARDTADVGSHPADTSPYGVQDMAGNAFEWTDTWVLVPPKASLDCVDRAVMGGGWLYTARRADEAIHFRTVLASHAIGFRCAWPR